MPEFGVEINKLQGFDSVVVASGHYHSPNVPDIPGLKEWKKRWPDRVQHSKGYRKPDDFKDQVGTGIKNHIRN
jgi:cation diffusion facilitator CzcD-associated flavoprotein CzcO